VIVPPRPPPPSEPMDAQVVEMLQRPPEDNRIAVSKTIYIIVHLVCILVPDRYLLRNFSC
jgi:hypothetical protein